MVKKIKFPQKIVIIIISVAILICSVFCMVPNKAFATSPIQLKLSTYSTSVYVDNKQSITAYCTKKDGSAVNTKNSKCYFTAYEKNGNKLTNVNVSVNNSNANKGIATISFIGNYSGIATLYISVRLNEENNETPSATCKVSVKQKQTTTKRRVTTIRHTTHRIYTTSRNIPTTRNYNTTRKKVVTTKKSSNKNQSTTKVVKRVELATVATTEEAKIVTETTKKSETTTKKSSDLLTEEIKNFNVVTKEGKIVMTWNKSKNLDGYEAACGTKENFYDMIFDGEGNTVTRRLYSTDKQYYFVVRGYKITGNVKKYTSYTKYFLVET